MYHLRLDLKIICIDKFNTEEAIDTEVPIGIDFFYSIFLGQHNVISVIILLRHIFTNFRSNTQACWIDHVSLQADNGLYCFLAYQSLN